MEKFELIKKLKALSDRGVGGEKENATVLLNKLMKKYGISEEELQEEKKQRVYITLKNEAEKAICYQILYAYFDSATVWGHKNCRTKYWVELTKAQEIEFKYMLSAYLESFYKEQEIFIRAFIQKNRIFPVDGPVVNIEDLSSEEKGKSIRASLMAEGLEFTRIRKALNE